MTIRGYKSWHTALGRCTPGAILLLTLFLLGCPPSPASLPVAITITDVRQFPDGGLSFSLSGTGFSPNGLVNVRMLNIPNEPAAVDLTNGSGLPNLTADPNGSFSRFPAKFDCPNFNQGQNDPPSDIFLHVVDVKTTSVAIAFFANVKFCGVIRAGPPIVVGFCPKGSSDPRCQHR
jgi:hypothetical protein